MMISLSWTEALHEEASTIGTCPAGKFLFELACITCKLSYQQVEIKKTISVI